LCVSAIVIAGGWELVDVQVALLERFVTAIKKESRGRHGHGNLELASQA
jgi:hypothetical protein